MDGILIVMFLAVLMGAGIGCYLTRQVYIDRFWKVERIVDKHFNKTTDSDFVCSRTTNMYYEGMFLGAKGKELEERVKEPNTIFVITK